MRHLGGRNPIGIGPTPSPSSSPFVDCTALSFITRAAIRDNRVSRGVWSRYGHPYVPHGIPDLHLDHRIAEAKSKRVELRQEIGVNVSGSATNKAHVLHQKPAVAAGDPTAAAGQREPIASSSGLRNLWQTPVKREVDMDRFQFPRDQIHLAEMRYRKGKNGTMFVSAKENIGNQSFPRMDLTKVKFENQQQSVNLKQKISATTSSRTFLFQTDANGVDDAVFESSNNIVKNTVKAEPIAGTPLVDREPKTVRHSFLNESPAQRWRQEFIALRKRLERTLQESLIRQKLAREDVLHDRTLLGKLATAAEQRAANRIVHRENVWSEVLHERDATKDSDLLALDGAFLDDRMRYDFYREIEVFVERLSVELEVPTFQDPSLVSAVDTIKTAIENRVPLDSTLLLNVMVKLGPSCYENPAQLSVLRFIRRYLGITLGQVRALSKMGLNLPASVETVLMENE